MSDTLIGRGLYPFVGASTASDSPTSDSTASTWASNPLPGQRAFETDTLDVYEWIGTQWVKIRGTDSSGAPAGNVIARVHGEPGALWTKELTINSGADIFTSKIAPVAAELIRVIPDLTGKKRCRVTWHTHRSYTVSATSDIPWAAAVVATLNAGDDLTALDRLKYVDAGVGTHTSDNRKRMLSENNAMIEWDLTGTDAAVDRLDMGAYAPTDTGAIPVYLLVEIW